MTVRIFLFLVFSCVSALAQTFTIGETSSVGNSTDSGNANAVLAQPVTLTQTATLQSLSFYVVNPAGNLVLGLYGSSSNTFTMGETNVLPTPDSGNANADLAQSATLTQPGTLQSLSFYVRAAAGKLVLGLYGTNAAGTPGQLLACTNPFVPVVGWNTQPVVTQAFLAPGTYWLAYWTNSNALGFTVGFTGKWYCEPLTYTGVLPTTFAQTFTGANHWSFYATLSGTSAAPAPGQLLAYTQPFVPVAGWNTQPVVNQPVLDPGTYFLAYSASDNNLSFPIFFSSNWCGDYPVVYSGMFPQSFAFVHGDANHWALYATLNVTARPGSPLSGKPGLKLFGGIQSTQASYWPDANWKPIGQATGIQFPSNWYRDDYQLGVGNWGNLSIAQEQAMWSTAATYCRNLGLNGPCVQLHYPGHMWTGSVSAWLAYIDAIAPFVAPGTYEIVSNEMLANNGASQNSDPLFVALGGTGVTGWDALINMVKLLRQHLPNALLGLNDFNGCCLTAGNTFFNQSASIAAYKACAQNGAPLDWYGAEGYWMAYVGGPDGNPEPLSGYQNAINTIGAGIAPYVTGNSPGGTIAFTEWTPAGNICGGGTTLYETQQATWQGFLPMFANNQYVFGVTGPWFGYRRSEAFTGWDWLYDDTNNGGGDPDCNSTSNGHVTPTLTWLQPWAAANVHP
jgi:hypothetical protein